MVFLFIPTPVFTGVSFVLSPVGHALHFADMVKVFQTINNNKNGNCLAAVWASLLHLPIDQVPNFVEQEDDHGALCEFLKPYGRHWGGYLINPHRELPDDVRGQYEHFDKELPPFGDVDGFYEATVFSPGYTDVNRLVNDKEYKSTCHAVVVDKYFNVVHDPCPYYKNPIYPLANLIGYNGIIGVSLWPKNKQHG